MTIDLAAEREMHPLEKGPVAPTPPLMDSPGHIQATLAGKQVDYNDCLKHLVEPAPAHIQQKL